MILSFLILILTFLNHYTIIINIVLTSTPITYSLCLGDSPHLSGAKSKVNLDFITKTCLFKIEKEKIV